MMSSRMTSPAFWCAIVASSRMTRLARSRSSLAALGRAAAAAARDRKPPSRRWRPRLAPHFFFFRRRPTSENGPSAMASYVMGMGAGISPSRRLTELLSAYLDFDDGGPSSDNAGASASAASVTRGSFFSDFHAMLPSYMSRHLPPPRSVLIDLTSMAPFHTHKESSRPLGL